MATFELNRASISEPFRHWNYRSLPLYAAGLLAGTAIGLGIAAYGTASPAAPTAREAAVPGFAIELPPAEPALSFAPMTGSPYATGYITTMGNLAEPPAGLVLPLDPLLIPEPAPVAEEPIAPIAADVPVPAAERPVPAPAASLPQVQPPPTTAQPEPEPVAATQPEPAAAPEKPNFYVPQVSAGPLNTMEQRFLDAANAERVAAGMAPLTLVHNLTVIARTRSQQLVDQGYFGHKDPYGYSMYVELLALHGYATYAWAGENLAMNNFSEAESPERAVVALMNSPTHKRNILATEFSRIGVGLVTLADGRKYYTMIFLS